MNLIAIAILAPLVAALLILLVRRASAGLALAGIMTSLLANFTLLTNAFNGTSNALLLPGLPDLPLHLAATPLTALLSTMVATISTLVLIYAAGYMKQDPKNPVFLPPCCYSYRPCRPWCWLAIGFCCSRHGKLSALAAIC